MSEENLENAIKKLDELIEEGKIKGWKLDETGFKIQLTRETIGKLNDLLRDEIK